MNYLIFVRHSISKIDPTRPADQWGLTEEGRQRCLGLAERVAVYQPSIIITSVEPKARQTGELIGKQLNLLVQTAANLHEHARRTVPWFDSKAEFEAQVARFFAEPDELVFGEETAEQSYHRFSQAVREVVAQYPQQNLVIATHGTVLSLFIGRTAGIDPYPFWQQLDMPAYVVMTWPDGHIVETVTSIVYQGDQDAVI